MKKNAMPVQAPEKRRHNFEEVALGYTAELAAAEAERCLNCKTKPCVSGCPVNVDIPDFIAKLRAGQLEAAFESISQHSSLPAVCGRVCPQETQCEKNCVRGIKGEPVAIGRLERYVADRHNAGAQAAAKRPQPSGRRMAVIGAGHAGIEAALACALLSYGIPEFRLPKSIVAREIEGLKALGVEIRTNEVIGKLHSVDELFAAGYEAAFVSTGAGLPKFMGIPGEMLLGVYSANEYLTRINLMKAYRPEAETPLADVHKVAVVGGGNVAMDAARCALRMGAQEVTIVYRRSRAEMPARREEVEHAEEEGVVLRTLTNPVEILADEAGHARALRCVRMELGEPDASGRRRPAPVAGSEFELEADAVIMAIGTSPNPLVKNTTPDLETDRRGCFVVDESMHTSKQGVWAGGDAVTGAATVISAMGAGKKAAAAISAYLATRGG